MFQRMKILSCYCMTSLTLTYDPRNVFYGKEAKSIVDSLSCTKSFEDFFFDIFNSRRSYHPL